MAEVLVAAAGTSRPVRVVVQRGLRACCGRQFLPFTETLELTGRIASVVDGEAMLVVDGIGGPTLWASFRLENVTEAEALVD